MRSGTERSAVPPFRELTTNWPAALAQVSILGKMRNFPAPARHLRAQLARGVVRGDWVGW